MAKITTHVLDTAAGKPAAGVRIRLFHDDALISEATTNEDGRCEAPLAIDAVAGAYKLIFSIGDYFRLNNVDSPFLDEIPVQFLVQVGEHYHVPLVCTPWSYSTYRGS